MTNEIFKHVMCRTPSPITGEWCWRCIWCGIEAQEGYAEVIGLEVLDVIAPCPRGEVREEEKFDG